MNCSLTVAIQFMETAARRREFMKPQVSIHDEVNRHSEHRTALPVPLGKICARDWVANPNEKSLRDSRNLLLYRGFTLGALTEHFPRLTF